MNVLHTGYLRLTKTKKILQPIVFFQNIDKVTTRELGLYTSYNVVIPSHNRQKLKLQSTPSETLDTINLYFLSLFPKRSAYIRIDRPNYKISRGRIDDKYLCQESCFWAKRLLFSSCSILNKIYQTMTLPLHWTNSKNIFAAKGH